MKQEAIITIKVDSETEEVNFKFDFSPEVEVKNPDENKAAIIAARMFQLLNGDGFVK